MAGLAQFVGDVGVGVVGVRAGVAELGARPLLDVVGAVALTGRAVDSALAVRVVRTDRGHLRVAVPGLDEGTGAVGAVVGAAEHGGAAVVLVLGPGLERVVERARGAVGVAREHVQQRLLVVRVRRVQPARRVIQARADVLDARAVRVLGDRSLVWGLVGNRGLIGCVLRSLLVRLLLVLVGEWVRLGNLVGRLLLRVRLWVWL